MKPDSLSHFLTCWNPFSGELWKSASQRRWIMILSFSSPLLSGHLRAAEPTYDFHADFERSRYKVGSIKGQQGWALDQGRAEVVEGAGMDGSSALVLYPADPFAQARLSLTMDRPVSNSVFVDLQMVMVAGDFDPAAEGLDVDSARVGLFRSPGQKEAFVWVFNGDGENGGEWLKTTKGIQVDAESGQARNWHRITVGEDRSEQTWGLWIDGDLVSSGLGFQNRREATGPVCILMGDHRGTVAVDDFGIWSGIQEADVKKFRPKGIMEKEPAIRGSAPTPNASPVPAVDTDGDGLPDAWEKARGLDLAQASDANADPDKDGLVNRDEFALGTDPNKSDVLAEHLPPPRTEVFGRMQLHTVRRGKSVDVRNPYRSQK